MDVKRQIPSTRLCLGLTVLSCLIIGGITCRTPQTLYSDPAYQLRSLQQYRVGESPTFNHLTMPNPENLKTDVHEWHSWWPPGPQLAVYPWVVLGSSMGTAVRLVVLECLLMGSLGWVLWFNLFNLPRWAQVVAALVLPWTHYASNSLFNFSADAFAFAMAPWMFWGASALVPVSREARRASGRHLGMSALFGLFLGSGFAMKYTIVFASLTVLLYLAVEGSLSSALAAAVGCSIPVAGLNALNQIMSQGMNPVVTTAGFHWEWSSLLWVIALPSLALTDGFGLMDYVFLHPTHGLLKNDYVLSLFGVPGGILIAAMLYRRRGVRGTRRLAILALMTAMASMLVIWNVSRVANYNARFFEVFSMALLPFLIEEGVDLWKTRSNPLFRVGVAAAGLFYVMIPPVYGVAAVVAKVIQRPSNYIYGPSYLYNGALAPVDLQEVRRQLLEGYDPTMDIWYLSDPLMALDIPGRAIVRFPDFSTIEELRLERYVSASPARIRVLLPSRFEDNGKGSVIRASFPQAGVWSRRNLQGSPHVLWEARLKGS